jgi:hypothetical protein
VFFIYLFIYYFLITADMLETSYPQAYLSREANGNNLLTGANFASAASGYFDATAELYVNTLRRKKKISLISYTSNYHIFQKFKFIKIGEMPNT